MIPASDNSSTPAISIAELYDVTGRTPATGGDHSAVVGEVVGALRPIERAKQEVASLLPERAALKTEKLSTREKAAKGLLNADGSDNAEAIAKRIADVERAIAHVYNRVAVITAAPGFTRTLAAVAEDKGALPTEAEMEAFFLLKDAWSPSDSLPDTLAEWAAALQLTDASKKAVLIELGRRTKGQREELRRKAAKDQAALIKLTATRVDGMAAGVASGKVTRGALRSFVADIERTYQVLALAGSQEFAGLVALSAQKLAPAASVTGTTLVPRSVAVNTFGRAEPLLLDARGFPGITG